MHVIQFPICRAWFFLDENRENVIRKWLNENDVSDADRVSLQALLDIYEGSGFHAIVASTVDLGEGFHALRSSRKGGIEPCPVFCAGPTGENEITFLAGARWDSKAKTVRPTYAVGVAKENLEELLKDRQRRVRERVARSFAR